MDIYIINYIIGNEGIFKMDKDTFFDSVTAIIAILNIILVYYVFKLTKKDLNPKLYVESTILTGDEDIEFTAHSNFNSDLSYTDFETKGFPQIKHSYSTWILKIKNNGDLPATRVEIEYSVIIQKANFEFGIDDADIKNLEFVDFKTLFDKQKFDYIPPNGEIIIKVINPTGEYPYAHLKINKLKSNERTFINKEIVLKTYEHEGLGHTEDMAHFRKLIGSYK